MSTNFHAPSPTIYEFPLRGRFALDARHEETSAAMRAQGLPAIAFGGAWYHDEAIEAERTRSN